MSTRSGNTVPVGEGRMGIGQQPWQALAALPAWQLTEIPRPDGNPADDTSAGQRFQALTSAYGSGEPLAVAWLRERPGGPVRVLTAGPALTSGQTDGGQTVLTLPSGARGIPLPDGQAARVLAGLPYWTRIAGVTDVLLAEDNPLGQQAPPSLEDGLLSAWLDAFGWLLLAEPVAEHVVAEMAADAARTQLQEENDRSPRAKLAARRAAARHAELRQAATAGLWRVHLLAGAATAGDAARVARLVCASADLRRLPYALAARRTAASLPDTLATTMSITTVPALPATTPPPRPDGQSWWDTPIGDQTRTGAAARWPDPRQSASPAAAAARAAGERDTMVPSSPFDGSTQLLAALARVPAREVPGLLFTLRPSFDVTPESALTAAGPVISAGVVLDRNRVPAGTLTLPLASLNRHVFVCGATGAGKSQTVRHLLEQATTAGIPWLVIEPAKAEYRLMATRLRATEVIRIRPGDLDQPAAGINPLEPAPGSGRSRFPLQVHADLLRALFLAAFQADEPFPQILSAALTRCYEQAGWDLVTGQPANAGIQPAYPSLQDLQTAALTTVDEAGYGREVRDNVRGFVTVRIGSLRLGTTGRFLDGGHPIDLAALLDRNVVLEIEDAGDDHDKAFLIGAVLIQLTEHLRLRARYEPPGPVMLRHLTVIEEAHRLLRQPPPGAAAAAAAQSVEMFADLLAEIRAYGEGLIIAEQIPVKLISDAVKNTAVKIAHRLPAADDRAVVGATMNLRQAQSEYLVTLRPGEAAVHADGMDYPLLARIPDGTARETTAPATTTSADPVIGRRSITCGPDCTTLPCTLGQMRAAQRVTVTDPRPTLWAELAVVAHLTGWDIPRPKSAFATALRATDPRLRNCALSQAVDAAVAARAPAISTRVSPAGLAAHVVTMLWQVVSDGTRGCAPEEPQYLAPPFQWTLLRDALKPAFPTTDAPRDPRSREWERTYGKPIPGATGAAQFTTVNHWHALAQRDTRAVTAVVWGTRPRPAIEQAVGTRPSSDDWTDQLTEALAAFVKLRWPLNLLSPGSAVTEKTSASGE